MSITPEERTKPRGPRHEGEEICHLVEAEDPDTALCGKDVTGLALEPAVAVLRGLRRHRQVAAAVD